MRQPDPIEETPGSSPGPQQQAALVKAIVFTQGRRLAALVTSEQAVEALARAKQYPGLAPDVRPWYKRLFNIK